MRCLLNASCGRLPWMRSCCGCVLQMFSKKLPRVRLEALANRHRVRHGSCPGKFSDARVKKLLGQAAGVRTSVRWRSRTATLQGNMPPGQSRCGRTPVAVGSSCNWCLGEELLAGPGAGAVPFEYFMGMVGVIVGGPIAGGRSPHRCGRRRYVSDVTDVGRGRGESRSRSCRPSREGRRCPLGPRSGSPSWEPARATRRSERKRTAMKEYWPAGAGRRVSTSLKFTPSSSCRRARRAVLVESPRHDDRSGSPTRSRWR